MNQDRWQRINEVFHAALTRPAAERSTFVAGECHDDDSVRREVESLLEQVDAQRGLAADAPGVTAGAERGSATLIGRRMGAYSIVSMLGSGGMGDVYRARDTTLGREVAIKILPRAFTADPERRARFEREARVLASLNHTNIGAIYGLEEADGVRGLVLELVEGGTLERRLTQGALPIAEAQSVARQIVEALDAAHERGIVHRDLKPGNIAFTRDGVVKVLDFGLAKVVTDAGSDSDSTEAAPTLSAGRTQEGLIIGTAAYMSPEQARGQMVDKRTDIWAFGCVLYEMLAGRPAFARQTISDTIAAVVGSEPNWKALPQRTPESVLRLLARCLEKDAKRRLHDIADARIELDEALPRGSVPAAQIVARFRRMGVRAAPWLVAIGALGVAAFTLIRLDMPSERAIAARVTRLTNLRGLEENPAISPDGRSVAFAAGEGNRRALFVQLIAGGAPLPVTRTPVDHQSPRWTPDSSTILYFSPAVAGEREGNIWEVPALGGVPRRVISSLGGADVGPDGRLALFRRHADEGIQLVTASRDASNVKVVSTFPQATYYLYPRWSPDGRWIAFQRGDSIRFDIFVVSAEGGEPRQLTHDNTMMSGFAWLPDSTAIIYSSSRGVTMPYLPSLSLWHVTLSDGTVRRVTSNEASYQQPDIARTGAMVAERVTLQSDIWRFPVDGPPADNVRRALRVTRQTGQVLTPTAGPGDKEVAFLSDSGGHANLWVVDTGSGELRQITHERDPNVAVGVPVWSPDGRSIAFVYSRGNKGLTFGVWLVDPDGSNLRNVANPGLGPAWSHDGRWLYYSTRGGAASVDVVLKKVPADGGPSTNVTTEKLRNVIGSDGNTLYYSFERPLVDGTPEFEIRAATPEDAPFRVLARIPASRVPIWQIVNPSLSPDGKSLAQALTDGLTTNIWALSTSTAEWRQITDFGDRPTFIARRVSWSSDGQSIFAAVGEGDSDIVLLEGVLESQPE